MTNNEVYLIDGNAYIHRAYHAISPLSNKEGLPTHAAFGFTKILTRILQEKNPRYLAIAFDAKGHNFRHQIYADYKANRPPMPDDLVVQLPYIKRIVKAHNILSLEQSGVEADDLLAAMTSDLTRQGLKVVIVSGDKDMLQLVSDSVSIWEPMNDKIMDSGAVLKKYGVKPAQLLDLFALIGDKSDNVPGVPGIGPKTAAKLIQEFSSIEALYENVSGLKKSKLKENLITNKEQAFLSKRLIRLKTDLESPPLQDYEVRAPDEEKLTDIYTYLGFHSMIPESKALESLDPADFHLITDEKDLELLTAKIAKAPFLVIDTETTSLDTMSAELVGISLCVGDDAAYYLPISHADKDNLLLAGQLPIATVSAALTPFLQDDKLPKLGHNLKYDYAVLARHNLEMRGPLWDTLLASYLLDSTRRSHKLDLLSEEFLQIKMTSFKEVTDAAGTDNFRFVPLRQAADYSCEDVACTLKLWRHLEPQLDSLNLWPLFSQVEILLIPILAEMEHNGILLDCQALASLSEEFAANLHELAGRIYEQAGMEFNINSPRQLAEILFEKLALPHGRKTKSGYSTDMKVLEKLAASHELPRLIIDYRNLAKLQSTYVNKLPRQINPQSGRLHTSFNQAVTATGRLSSSNPNLQNIPIRTAAGQRIRAAFLAAPGQMFMAADYSQIDLRVLAHYAKDQVLIQAFNTGGDIHRQTAAQIFRISPEFVTAPMRQVAKGINFGIVYGMSAFGLAQQLRISRREAATFIERYFELYQGVRQFMTDVVEKARIEGFVTTMLGRRRQLPDINSKNKTRREFAERTALNTPIQGTAADIIKLATIKVDQQLKGLELQAKLILQIHDELVLEVPKAEIEKTQEVVKAAMETVLDLAVPLTVNITTSKNLAKG
ncbi:MAG: DNA polymerase I [Deltaproteobacteria bacterium]|nr:DNA polymerase I [Deltaproteobacteria bacterium]